MALTMTRTRTQTALNDLASRLAEVNGELEFLAGLGAVPEEHQALAASRRDDLLRLREALFVVIKRYDETLEPEDVGATFNWMKAFGRKLTPSMVGRYCASLSAM
jgi:hypothetical protein